MTMPSLYRRLKQLRNELPQDDAIAQPESGVGGDSGYGNGKSAPSPALATSPGTEAQRLQKLLDVTEELDHIADLDSLLDHILIEARAFTGADAGTIYLVEGDYLRFSYNSQSGLFAPGDPNRNRLLYLNHTMPINKRSIAGYVAETGSALVIDDAYAIGDDVPYAFNPAFDRETGYRTVSMLTLPLKAKGGSTVGVMQLVNALDPDTHQPVAFAERDRLYVALFAQNAAVEIERASLTRLIILRMIRMAELRDPGETGAHVSRVAAYSIEIYQRWAETHGVKATELRKNKDVLRLGAMLHDVGKIAIPDAILKKPGGLSADERETMKQHTVFGARLFKEWESRLDAVASEIALTHHERWDGSGYPGVIENLEQEPIRPGRGKREDEIPLLGRIVALADVYDALISHRTYKEPWSEDRVLETIREEAGYQFDPEVVDAFFDVYETIQAIRARYTE
jgi:hypothetical protein